jgi:hypothetical protein
MKTLVGRTTSGSSSLEPTRASEWAGSEGSLVHRGDSLERDPARPSRRPLRDRHRCTNERAGYRPDGHLRGPLPRHIREERRPCTATPASHRRPRASHQDRGSSRPRPRRTAADSASPGKGPSAGASSSEWEPMPSPPAPVARGPVRCGVSPSSSTAPGSSPRGRPRSDVSDPSGTSPQSLS